MISSKSEKSSRRSSILKLPKPRPPLQSVEANGSTVEDTPMKQKRRVSFAEKKHVKEFCDSMEQGTVWDNTYEESELSHTKHTLQSNTDDNSNIQVLSEISNATHYQSSSQETSVVVHHQSKKVLIRQNAIDLDHLPIEAIRSRLEPGDIDHVIMSANPELLANKENIPAVLKLSVVESSLIEDDELIFRQKYQQKSTSQSFSVYCDDNMDDENNDNVLNKTDHNDVSMDCTLPATDSILSSNIDNAMKIRHEVNNFARSTDRTRVFEEDNTMEMTNAVSSVLRPRLKEQNGTMVFHNKSMETTEVVPSSCPPVSYSNIRMNETMEFTQVVPPSSRILTQQRMVDDATQVFHNRSMEMTEVVPSKFPERFREERTQVFHNKSMEMTKVVPSQLPERFCEEKTQFFHNKSMEMTEVVPPKFPERFCEERTQLFHNKSMEMTEVVPSQLPERFCEEKTQFFHNKSMEMTEVVPPKFPERFCEETTQLFHIKSMEMTKVVPSQLPEQFCEEKTQFFHNKSMEMTEVVPPKLPERFCEERTQLFHNKSMEMTEIVPSKYPEQFCDERTQFFHNKSMEMTEVVPSKSQQFSENRTPLFHNKLMELNVAMPSARPVGFPENRTQIFPNTSMEMTEAVLAGYNPIRPEQIPQNDIGASNDNSMELTEALSSIHPKQCLGNRTQIFLNNSMEMTEAVPIAPYSRHPLPIEEDKTQIFRNESMEITGAITPQFSASAIQYNKPQLTKGVLDTSNRTQIFANYCMEHTEVIPSLKRQYQQISENKNLDYESTSPNAKNLRNNSIHYERRVSEADRAALHRLLHRNLDESLEKSVPQSTPLPNCIDQSMEITAAVPEHFGRASYLHQNNSQMANISMEITEVIPSFSNKVNATNDNPEDSSIAPHAEKFCGDNTSTHTSPIKISVPNQGTPDRNVDDSVEQLRFHANSVSKVCHEDITYNLTAPINSEKVNNNTINILEDIEEPSFVYANISDDAPLCEAAKEIEDVEPMPLPEISMTEDINQFDNRRRTYVMSRDAREGCFGLCEEMNESVICSTDELRRSTVKIIENVPVDDMENIITSPEINSQENRTVHNERSCITSARRRTYIVDKNEENEMAGKRKVIRSDRTPHLIKSTINEIPAGKNSDKIETSESDASQPCSSTPKIIEPVRQSRTVAKVIISPIKKINLDFKELAENDLIVARIEKQQRIMAAKASEKNVVKAGENRLELESPVESMNSIKTENKSRYDILVDQLNEIANKHDTIWRVHSTSQTVIIIEFCMTAILLKMVFNVPDHPNELEIIDRVEIIPCMSEKENAILQLTDRLIVQKIDVESLKRNYRTYDDVLNLIEYVTKEVNSVFNFYHELIRLSRINTMKVTLDKISFRLWTKKMDIILNISMNMKPFVDIQPEDIDVTCLLGSIKVNDVKNLIRNVKRDHKFLTFYINDIKHYIELMEMCQQGRANNNVIVRNKEGI